MQRKQVSKDNRYFLKDLETLPREQLRDLQFKETRKILEMAYQNSRFYKRLFDNARVKPEDFKSLDDIARFPLIDKKDLMLDQEELPPFGNRVCVPLKEIRRVNLTSGTSGMGQEIHCHDEGAIWAANASTASHFAAIGMSEGDISVLLYPLATMTGGMLSYEALRLFGATPLPLAVFNTKQKIEMMRRFPISHILTTPAYLTRITSILTEQGLNPRKEFPGLVGITLSTEPFSVAWALRMEDLWGTTLHDIYGSTQLNLNYAVTCKFGVIPDGACGHYHLADYFALVEVLDPNTLEPVKYGDCGEPVVTTFSRKAMPLIRFRSNDRVRLLPPETCDCGRTSMALWEVGTISRYDDMIKIKATNVWPQSVDEVVFSFKEIDEYSGKVYIDESGQEIAKLSIEFHRYFDETENKKILIDKLRQEIKEKTQVNMMVEEVAPGTIPRFEYKVRRWTDDRIHGLERVRFLENKGDS